MPLQSGRGELGTYSSLFQDASAPTHLHGFERAPPRPTQEVLEINSHPKVHPPLCGLRDGE
jgi:hypothetical protein